MRRIFYDDLMADHRGPKCEVAIILRREDGTETEAVIFHGATVSMISATDVEDDWWGFPPTRLPRQIHQARITSMEGYTAYDTSFFEDRKGITDGG